MDKSLAHYTVFNRYPNAGWIPSPNKTCSILCQRIAQLLIGIVLHLQSSRSVVEYFHHSFVCFYHPLYKGQSQSPTHLGISVFTAALICAPEGFQEMSHFFIGHPFSGIGNTYLNGIVNACHPYRNGTVHWSVFRNVTNKLIIARLMSSRSGPQHNTGINIQ